jgi:two-component system, OmpR family, phosphate regulon sensor histidine kinase PhoR
VKASGLEKYLDGLPWRFFRKLALMQIIITSLMIVTTAYIARYYLRTYITTQAQEHLEESLGFIIKSHSDSEYDINEWCSRLKWHSKARFTLIALDGTPLCDTQVPLQELNNHNDRPEVILAFEEAIGFSSRFSGSTGTRFMYGAIIIRDNEDRPQFILRQSFPLEQMTSAMKSLDRSIMIFVFPLLILTSLFSLYGSLQVSSPLRSLLAKIDHMKRISHRARDKESLSSNDQSFLERESDEWLLLEKTLDRAKVDLENYLSELYVENEKITILMESISDSILAISKSEMILLANGQFKKNFVPLDFKKRDLTDYKIWEIFRDTEVQEIYREVLQSEVSKKVRNLQFDIKGGKAKGYFDMTVSPMHDSQNNVIGAVCVFHNVTDRKSAEQLREDFVTNVSHEVRTPLTALKGYVQILKSTLNEEKMSEEIQNCLNRIESNSDRLTHLFNDILNLSVIESKRKVNKTLISTEEITSSVLANVKQSYLSKKIEVQTDYISTDVYANGPLLEQVLTNLLDNAFKYTPDKGKVSILWNTDSHYYVLTIKDDGEQIPREHHPRLFERFYRVDSSRSRGQGGTGLGLAIVKHIVQKHYGSISVGHNPEGGNYFCVKFPIREKFQA